jgi:hypothetical protein
MKKTIFALTATLISSIMSASAQGPEITSWLQNTTQNGTYYVQGNSTPIDNGILFNCQEVSYSTDYSYIKTHGIPAYPTGPFLDGNPSLATDQNAIFQIPRFPTPAANNQTTTGGRIGVFVNGVSLFDYRDGVAWNPATTALCGGPGNAPCPGGPMATMDWNRDAIPAEMDGFDCSKGHPAMGNYHHHQNPSAFDLDINVVSTICNLYDADGLYAIDGATHSPLLGFAYDGYPIYGAYGYANENGTGGITRMISGYELGTTPDRSTYPDGSASDLGPAINGTYPRGTFREDYIFVASSSEDHLDAHNGRECITPEYPNGTYAYFCTVDGNWNSAYPYAVGPTFYGVYANRLVTTISETVTVYEPTNSLTEAQFNNLDINVFPNPATDLIAIQVGGLVSQEMNVTLIDIVGKVIATSTIHEGQTITYFDVSTVYSGTYFVKVSTDDMVTTKQVVVQ